MRRKGVSAECIEQFVSLSFHVTFLLRRTVCRGPRISFPARNLFRGRKCRHKPASECMMSRAVRSDCLCRNTICTLRSLGMASLSSEAPVRLQEINFRAFVFHPFFFGAVKRRLREIFFVSYNILFHSRFFVNLTNCGLDMDFLLNVWYNI